MIEYNCPKCNSSWSTSVSTEKCPFCGEAFRQAIPDNKSFASMDELITYMLSTYGNKVFLQKSSIIGTMRDLAPNLNREIKLFHIAFESNAIQLLEVAKNTDDCDWQAQIHRVKQRLVEDYFLSDMHANLLISWLLLLFNRGGPCKPSVVTKPVITPTNGSNSKTKNTVSANTTIKTGMEIVFGNYPIDAQGTIAPITWYVLDIKDGNAMLMSKYCIDAQKYNFGLDATTWETCSLRKWLNTDFLNKAFTSTEQAGIQVTTNLNEGNSQYLVPGGFETRDQIFLLSFSEAHRYLQPRDNTVKATRYAEENGAESVSENGSVWWWLRSPGCEANKACMVYPGVKQISNFGSNAYYVGGIRPVLWVSLNSI